MRTKPQEQREESVSELGTRAYCDLAAFALFNHFPDASLHRVTDKTKRRFAHVFLIVDGWSLDVNGFSTVQALLKEFGEDGFLIDETSVEAVTAYFSRNGQLAPEEERIVTHRFQEYIQERRETTFRKPHEYCAPS